MVRYQLETGSDGIFFDNPTVHPQGCYCPHCMRAFAKYFVRHASKPVGPESHGRHRGHSRTCRFRTREYFLRFRATIARDFLADMRKYARTINPRALITCNNSLNSPSVFYSQCRMYGYNIDEMSKTEDLVVVEDMNSQPRTEANGQTVEYGPIVQAAARDQSWEADRRGHDCERRLSYAAELDAAGDGRGGGEQRVVFVVADVAGRSAQANDRGGSSAGGFLAPQCEVVERRAVSGGCRVVLAVSAMGEDGSMRSQRAWPPHLRKRTFSTKSYPKTIWNAFVKEKSSARVARRIALGFHAARTAELADD